MRLRNFTALLVLVSACGGATPQPEPTDEGAVVWQNIGRDTAFTELVLPDGTRCFVTDGSYSGGIDCIEADSG